MSDLFGHTTPPPVRKPYRDFAIRDSVAEEKAELALVLHDLCRTVPAAINSASIQRTREYIVVLTAARKVLASTRSSRQQLSTAINQLRAFEK